MFSRPLPRGWFFSRRLRPPQRTPTRSTTFRPRTAILIGPSTMTARRWCTVLRAPRPVSTRVTRRTTTVAWLLCRGRRRRRRGITASAAAFRWLGIRRRGSATATTAPLPLALSDPLAQLLTPGVYAGALDDPGLVYGTPFHSIANLFLDGRGDIAFADTLNEELYQAYNTTPAPEPGTLVLLATGLGAGIVVQRKMLA